MRFLLIEDNLKLSQAIMEQLRMDGHAVDHAATLAAAADCTAVAKYDLILLDIMLPDGDGRSFLEGQRKRALSTPVIVLTARSEVSDRVGSLDLGADDYITKPFDFSELMARCRAVLRRRGGPARNERVFAGVVLDSLRAELRFGNTTVALRNRELRMLEVFFNAPERVLSKAHLMERLFSFSDDVTENAIEVYVVRLRKRLEGSPARIETVRGLGYRLAAA